jgi:hypothetical protein
MISNSVKTSDRKSLNIGLISTTHTNVGDDLIRAGIVNLFSALLADGYQLETLNKHRPLQVYKKGSPARFFDLTSAGRHRIERAIWRNASTVLGPISRTVFDECDLVVNCGMPAFWPDWQDAEWVRPLWYEVVPRLVSNGAIFCHLSIGSAFPWTANKEIALSDKEAGAIRQLIEPASFTSTRDSLTAALIWRLGMAATKQCCTSLFAFHGRPPQAAKAPVFIINYMRNASHFSWGAKRNIRWRETISEVIKVVSERQIGVRFYCHSANEFESVGDDFPGFERIRPTDVDIFFRNAGGCVGSLCTRFHASLGLAAMGVPGIVVAEDSRSVMVEEIGNRFLYAPDANMEVVVAEVRSLLAEAADRSQRLVLQREKHWSDYLSFLSDALGNHFPSAIRQGS